MNEWIVTGDNYKLTLLKGGDALGKIQGYVNVLCKPSTDYTKSQLLNYYNQLITEHSSIQLQQESLIDYKAAVQLYVAPKLVKFVRLVLDSFRAKIGGRGEFSYLIYIISALFLSWYLLGKISMLLATISIVG